MIYLACPGSRNDAADVVAAALRRSCGGSAVQRVSPALWSALLATGRRGVFAVVDPLDSWTPLVAQARATQGSKVVIFGALPPSLAAGLGVTAAPVADALREAAQCAPAPSLGQSESALAVHYVRAVGDTASPMASRPFLRYDFTDEWNNLGYGAIRADGSIWALAQAAQLPAANVLAHVVQGGKRECDYAGLWDTPGDSPSSLLWFNRPVGPVDSQEWLLVESFLASYRHTALACQPVLREIPHGYQAAVTMRLDCDEDVESARPLWDAYRELEVPFSLALHAKVLHDDARHHVLPREVAAAGGAILSHTATHAPDWGGSYEAALAEATRSAADILAATGIRVRHAVSPFHQTPAYARDGLADAEYEGCIGGIIRNDPDFLMARAGLPPGGGLVGHSQQCMLHGDCMLDGPDRLAVFKAAFDIARKGGAFFGYLDHPFSPRYQYGWRDEVLRVQVHRDFIAFLKSHGGVLFGNENDAMDFLTYRAGIDVIDMDRAGARAGFSVLPPSHGRSSRWQASVEYAGMLHAVPAGGLAL